MKKQKRRIEKAKDFASLEGELRANMNIFPSKTRRVAEYILGNSSELAFSSISETAAKLKVSRAQLVRVSRVLGFSGYAELKGILKRELLTQVIPSKIGVELGNEDDIPVELHKLEQANIEETCKNLLLSKDDLEKFCESIKKADCIYCMGWGISAIPSEWFYTRLNELGLKSVLVRRGSLSLLEQIRGIGKKDMLVVFELANYVIEVTEAVKDTRLKKAHIGVITDSPAAPLCEYSDEKFYVSDNSPLFGSSLIGMTYAVQVLTCMLACSMGAKGKEALKHQKETLADKRIYFPHFER